jgi:ketosteroid isomerase-like protein
MNRLQPGTLLGLAVIFFSTASAQQVSRTEADVLQVQAERNKALLSQDLTALERILADELLWCHSSASLENRSQFLERVRTGASRWLKLERRDMRVHVYGNAAVVTGQLEQTTTGPGRSASDRTLHTIEVYVQRDGRWQLADFQAVAVPNR